MESIRRIARNSDSNKVKNERKVVKQGYRIKNNIRRCI